MGERVTSYPKHIQYLALVSTTLTFLGDSVETYLPAVVTQPVSSNLHLSKSAESVLALSFYVTTAVSVFLSIPFAVHFGRRTTLLISLYLSVIFTVLYAVVPNYSSLLISRLLIGFAVGLNDMVNFLYISDYERHRILHLRYDGPIYSLQCRWGLGWRTWVSIFGENWVEILRTTNFDTVLRFPYYCFSVHLTRNKTD